MSKKKHENAEEKKRRLHDMLNKIVEKMPNKKYEVIAAEYDKQSFYDVFDLLISKGYYDEVEELLNDYKRNKSEALQEFFSLMFQLWDRYLEFEGKLNLDDEAAIVLAIPSNRNFGEPLERKY